MRRASIVLIGLLGAAWLAGPALATSATITWGWWSHTSTAGTGIPPQNPPDVPANGLLVQSGPAGPIAVAAVSYPVPAGSSVVSVTLTIDGHPLLSAPPQAALITKPFTPAQDGAFADHPAYETTHEVTGQIDATGTHVTFRPPSSMLEDGYLRLMILAGGTADRVVFDAPTPNSLTLSQASSNTAAGLTFPPQSDPSTPTAGAAPVSPVTPTGSADPVAGNGVVPAVVSPSAVAFSEPAASPAPQIAGSASGGNASIASGQQSSGKDNSPELASGTHHRSGTVPTVMGFGLLVLVLIYWADGFGAIPIRSTVSREIVGNRHPASRISSERDGGT